MSECITINVGGKLFMTSRDTLTRISDSYFSACINSSMSHSVDAHGNLFIDRDPKYFRQILSYMRSPEYGIVLPTDPIDKRNMLIELNYYSLISPSYVHKHIYRFSESDLYIDDKLVYNLPFTFSMYGLCGRKHADNAEIYVCGGRSSNRHNSTTFKLVGSHDIGNASMTLKYDYKYIPLPNMNTGMYSARSIIYENTLATFGNTLNNISCETLNLNTNNKWNICKFPELKSGDPTPIVFNDKVYVFCYDSRLYTTDNFDTWSLDTTYENNRVNMAVTEYSGCICLLGGRPVNSNDNGSNICIKIDIRQKNTISMANLNVRRIRGTAYVYNDNLYIDGGYTVSESSPSLVAAHLKGHGIAGDKQICSIEQYEPRMNVWFISGNSPAFGTCVI